MTALTGATNRRGPVSQHRDLLAKGGVQIHKGAILVSEADGFARPMAAGLTAPKFEGFANDDLDTTGESDGAKRIRAMSKGRVVESEVTGAADEGNRGATVFAADDGDGLSLTDGGNDAAIGAISNYESSQGFFIDYEAATSRSL